MTAQAPEKVVRVPYVPEFVKDEIRQQVRTELQEDVVGAVMSQAKQERWGIPEAMPAWTQRIKVKGDIRLRAEGDLFGSNNVFGSHIDYQKLNDGSSSFLLNNTEDRNRARMRMRLSVSGKVTNNLKAGVRLATGSTDNPVSTNQTSGESFKPYSIFLDRAYLKYDDYDLNSYPWLTLWGGRIPNPFFSTSLVWDKDVNFEGAAATFRYNLSGGNDLFDMDEHNRTLFMTVGAFPLQEVALSQDDKWLFAGQLGTELIGDDQSSFKVGLAYYNYHNITGRLNDPTNNLLDYTAPDFMQKGNSLFDINAQQPSTSPFLFGLASDYDLANLTARYDYAKFAPLHMIVTGDYVRNVGYNANDIRNRIGGSALRVNGTFDTGNPDDKQNEGYYLKFTVGWPDVSLRRNWQASLGYKYLERDAVLDAYTDSDFHLGGTNAKGWILGGKYGINDNAWVSARYLSADEIDGLPLAIDVLQLDLNAKF